MNNPSTTIGSILIVDDEEENADIIKDTLEDVNYQVVLATNAQEAKIAVKTQDFDLILMDIWMPGVDGITLLKEWKASGFQTPVVIISGHGDIQTAVDAIKLGAVDYLSKPLLNLLPNIRKIFANLNSDQSQPVVSDEADYLQLPLKEARQAFERAYFLHHLESNNHNIATVAQIAQLERTTLYRKLKDLDIDKK